ncbi:unnamed protein product [Rodentolepis nana]|uniref:Uncharacterized protein n=1 Tax=Rodentolepis nana TaxID=102285 RepID=A0A0R3TAA6_RODNA|nr:unnamed protein product [Rodentolepis nana]
MILKFLILLRLGNRVTNFLPVKRDDRIGDEIGAIFWNSSGAKYIRRGLYRFPLISEFLIAFSLLRLDN